MERQLAGDVVVDIDDRERLRVGSHFSTGEASDPLRLSATALARLTGPPSNALTT